LPPQEKISLRAQPDQLVVDHVGRHPHEGEVAPALPDHLVARRVRDQVGEALERDGLPVADELGDRFGEGHDLCHQRALRVTQISFRAKGAPRVSATAAIVLTPAPLLPAGRRLRCRFAGKLR
jgi:hypothetical protein